MRGLPPEARVTSTMRRAGRVRNRRRLPYSLGAYSSGSAGVSWVSRHTWEARLAQKWSSLPGACACLGRPGGERCSQRREAYDSRLFLEITVVVKED
jgi:hypothetical protein